jgi:hypothetical protein
MLRILFVSAIMAGLSVPIWAQAEPAAEAPRTQVGVGFSFGPPDYTLPYIKGVTLYASYDLKSHSGMIFEFHDLNLSGRYVGEESFMFGARYGIYRGRFHFYVKGLVGIGLVQFKNGFSGQPPGTSGYEVFAAGGGLEYLISRHLNLRVGDFEYQGWPGYKPDGLTPWVVTSGIAYKF